MKFTKRQRERIRRAVEKAIAQTKERNRLREEARWRFLKTMNIPLT